MLRTLDDIEAAWDTVQDGALILEAFVPFDYEFSLISVRGLDSEIKHYPPVLNTHVRGILRTSVAPSDVIQPDIEQMAKMIAANALQKLNYVGVLAIEFFCHDSKVLVNEMAPRVHNSGHWTQNGAVTSQFENHIRAICGMPLGSTDASGSAAMINLIGGCPDTTVLLAEDKVHLHLYNKGPRESRKIGHLNLCQASASELAIKIEQVSALVAPTQNG